MKLSNNKVQRKIENAEAQASNVGNIPKLVKIILYILLALLAAGSLIPLLLTFAVSITENQTLAANGYSLFPEKYSLAAYTYILKNATAVWRAYGVTIVVTVAGTLLGLTVQTMFAYVISRKYFPWRNAFTFFIYFTTLFNGGMIPTYMVITQVLNLRDTLAVLIIPGCVSVMYILILRTFMATSIPDAVVESAKIDGAKEFRCFSQIVLPMSLPSVMTIMLFMAVGYWNDWYTGFLYLLNNDKLVNIQLYLKRIENDMMFFSQEATNGMTPAQAAEYRKTMPTESFRMALVMLVVIPLLIAYPFFQKYFVKGMTIGAVKG